MAHAENQIYKRIKLLGQGSFGKAYLVESLADNSLCVIKQMDLNAMTEPEKKETLKEAKILQAFSHPNIVKFREVYKTKKGLLCIVMDYADGGDLGKVVSEAKNPIPESQILDWFTQICLALKHVHDRKIIHRDLKSQNIFLTKENMIKLGDFGISRVLTNTVEKAKTMVGTPYYLSPELIEGKPYSFKTDIWSLGVVLYELCSLKPPFGGNNLHFLALNIVKGKYAPLSNFYSKELKNLVANLLTCDPNRRPSIHEILRMQVVQGRIKDFLTESQRNFEFSHTILHNRVVDVRQPSFQMRDFPENSIAPMTNKAALQGNNNQQIDQKNVPSVAPVKGAGGPVTNQQGKNNNNYNPNNKMAPAVGQMPPAGLKIQKNESKEVLKKVAEQNLVAPSVLKAPALPSNNELEKKLGMGNDIAKKPHPQSAMPNANKREVANIKPPSPVTNQQLNPDNQKGMKPPGKPVSIGGNLGGAEGGMIVVPNFSEKEKKKASISGGVKKPENPKPQGGAGAPGGGKGVNVSNYNSGSKPEIANQKNQDAMKKLEANKKKEEEERQKREKARQEEEKRKKQIDVQRVEKEQEREEQRRKMREDIDKKRSQMSKQPVVVEWRGVLQPKTEEESNSKGVATDRKPKEEVLNDKLDTVKRKPWKEDKSEAEDLRLKKQQSNPEDRTGKKEPKKEIPVEIYVSERRPTKSATANANKNEVVQPNPEEIEKQEAEYAKMLSELDNLVNEVNEKADSLPKEEETDIQKMISNFKVDEDVEDDPLELTADTESGVNINKNDEENLMALSNFSYLEILRNELMNLLGSDNFLRVYRKLKNELDSKPIEEVDDYYGGEKKYQEIFPDIHSELRERYMKILYTYITVENKFESN